MLFAIFIASPPHLPTTRREGEEKKKGEVFTRWVQHTLAFTRASQFFGMEMKDFMLSWKIGTKGNGGNGATTILTIAILLHPASFRSTAVYQRINEP